ncbi:hypothetical protein A5757_13430 [Mycobacterium sp. 852013-51886_SCH5428379]|uniref:hypothetical protein n=1 Tax=Mycobacterium sp. 852013-51886_SCH5428379 TaxID=1834111 RepID=UPI0008013EDA|nr:hypothetical protein [Mycobacterium sp. 852013-51886_SCH5428379]OBB59334.1 hypothetical protein A5757_13430 [Mycobacterium sp. 852013-51886_SCH5428379]
MDLTARSVLSAGVALTAASAIAFTPVALPPQHVSAPPVPVLTAPEVQLAVTSTQIGALAGMPVQALIGVVDNIVRSIDGTFTGLIDATDGAKGVAALTILKTLSVDAFAKLSENLTLGNAVIMSTVTEVADLVATAGDRRVVDTGLAVVGALAEAGAELVRIAVGEVTFQFTNAVTRLGELVTVLAAPETVVDDGEDTAPSSGFVVDRRPDAGGVTRGGDTEMTDDEAPQRAPIATGGRADAGIDTDTDREASPDTPSTQSDASAGITR